MKHNLMKRVLAAALTLTLTAGVGTFSTAVPFTTITVNAEQANSNDGSVFFDADTGTLYLDGHFSEQNVSAFKGEQYEVKHIITMEGSSLPQNCKQLFENFSKVTTIDLRQASAANVNDMSYMFSGCTALTFADLGTMDTKNVNDMSGMFMGCESLKYVDLSGLNTVNVTNMSGMFISCTNLLEVNMAGFNTFKVTDMSRMFAECSNIELIDLTCFDTSGVSRMAGMFYKCYKLREICVSSDTWNVDNVTKSSGMFEGCESLAGEFSTLWSASNPQDKTYAAQNIKDDKPGYLTGTIKVSLPDHVSLTYESASMKLANGDFTSIAVVRLIPDIGYTFSGDIKFNGEVCQPDSDGEYSYVSFGKNVSVTVDSIEKTDRAPDGKGTKDDPYLISNTANWEALGDFLNARGDTIGKYFKLTNDITVQTMVGGDIPFSGIFDGCGHRITADLTSGNGCAPFKNIRNAAVFENHPAKYTVEWQDEDGRRLKSDTVEYGTVPQYTGATPEKFQDEQYKYTFSGWTPEVTAVTGPVTYTATYRAELQKYYVVFINDIVNDNPVGVSEVEVPYGSKVEKPKTPYKSGYTFDGWYSIEFLGFDYDGQPILDESIYNFNEPVKHYIELLAHWRKVEPVKNTSTIKSKYVTLGSPIIINTGAENGSGNYVYFVRYRKSTSEKWTYLNDGDYITRSIVKINPAAAVSYDIEVVAADDRYFSLKNLFLSAKNPDDIPFVDDSDFYEINLLPSR